MGLTRPINCKSQNGSTLQLAVRQSTTADLPWANIDNIAANVDFDPGTTLRISTNYADTYSSGNLHGFSSLIKDTGTNTLIHERHEHL